MLRCVRPGCPTACGTRRKPSCVDRMLHYGLLALLTVAFIISLAIGLMSLSKAEDHSRRVPESLPIAPAETLELMSETDDDGREGIRRNCDRKPAFLADAFVQTPQ